MGCFTLIFGCLSIRFLSFFYSKHMLRKLIASLSAFAVMAASLAPVVSAAPVVTDSELIHAVTWSYNNGLTKYDQADAFMPFNNLTREQAAKFASEFAEAIRNIAPDTTRTTVCEFKDVSIMDHTLVDSVVKSCQQSIMMGYQGNFMPKQLLTRGQFATMVSRMLGGIDAMSTEQAHFDYLNGLGIMNVANLTSSITRGDAMLMLYRVANGSSPDLCAIDPNLPGCSTTEPIVKQGDLNVALNPASPVNYSSIPVVGKVNFGTVDFTAGSKDITLMSVNLQRQGLGQFSDTKRVYFEKDGVRVSSRASVSSDNEAVVTFVPAIVIPVGKTVSLNLIVEMSGDVTQLGGEHRFVSTSINSSAANVIGSFTTPTLRTANYAVATVNVTANATDYSYPVDASKVVVLGDFRVENPSDRDVTFKGVTLWNQGSAKGEYLSGLALYRGDVLVSSVAKVDGRYVTFGSSNGNLIKQGTTATYTVKAAITNADQLTDTYKFQVRKVEDINAVETNSLFAVAVSPNSTPVAQMGEIRITGADLRFTDSAKTYSVTKVPGSTGVEFFTGTVSSKTAVSIEDLELAYTVSGTDLSKYTNRVYLQIGNTIYSASAPTDGSALKFEGTVSIPANVVLPVRVYADLKDSAPVGYIDFKASKINLDAFKGIKEYVSSQEQLTSSVGSIYGNRVTVTQASLRLDNATASTKNVVRGERNVTIATPVFSTTADINVKVNAFDVVVTKSGNFKGGTIQVYNGATVIAEASIQNTGNTTETLTFTPSTALSVVKGSDVKLTIVLDVVSRDTASGDNISFVVNGVKAIDALNSNSITPVQPSVNGVTLNVVDASTVNVSSNPSSEPQLVIAGTNATVGSLRVTAQNATSTLKEITAFLSGGVTNGQLSNIKLIVDGNPVTATVDKIGGSAGTGLHFTEMTYEVPAGKTVTFNVTADIANVSSETDLLNKSSLVTYYSGAAFETLAGDPFTNTQSGTISSPIEIVKSKPTVAFDRVIKGADYATYVFTVTPSNGELRLDQLVFNLGNNLAAAPTGPVELSTAVNGGNVYSSSLITTGEATFVTNISITDKTTLYLNVKGVTWSVSAGGNVPYVSIGLKDLNYSDVMTDGYVPHLNVLSKFFSAIAGSSDLSKNVQ